MSIKPENQFKYGIREVEIYIWFKAGSKQRIYFHPPGEFLTSRQRQYLDLGINEKVELDLEHQIDTVMSLGHQSCHPDPDYDRDQCIVYTKHFVQCLNGRIWLYNTLGTNQRPDLYQ